MSQRNVRNERTPHNRLPSFQSQDYSTALGIPSARSSNSEAALSLVSLDVPYSSSKQVPSPRPYTLKPVVMRLTQTEAPGPRTGDVGFISGLPVLSSATARCSG